MGAFTKREGPLQLGGLIGFVTLFHIVVQPDCMTNHCPCSVYQDQHRFSTSNGICNYACWTGCGSWGVSTGMMVCASLSNSAAH